MDSVFPEKTTNWDNEDVYVGGLTLRDYFAAKALPMCMTANENARTVAGMAYSMANAMLKQREVKND